MGFFNRAREAVFGLGKKIYNFAEKAAPYAYAGIKTLINHPGFIGQLGGLATNALGLAGQVASGNLPGAVAAGTALGALGSKTYSDISKTYKSELAAAKSGQKKAKAALKMSANEIANLKEGISTLRGRKKNTPQPNINE